MNSSRANFNRLREKKQIEVFFYDRSDINGYIELFDSVKKKFKTVFLLGVGSQYKATIDTFYRGKFMPNELPKFGGWMFGYALNEDLRSDSSNIVDSKIFEITDLDIRRPSYMEVVPPNLDLFMLEFGRLHPGLRDEVFSYDAGICIKTAFDELHSSLKLDPSKHIDLTNRTLEYFNTLINESNTPFDGVSGKINFTNGVNIGRSLNCAIFRSGKKAWIPVDQTDLVEMP